MSSLATESGSKGERIRVRGLVQGVGFRPTVWRLARDCGLIGEVLNDGEGVLIHIWGARQARERFLARLHSEVPPLARIDTVERNPWQQETALTEFRIVPSHSSKARTGVVSDAATCPACAEESLNSDNRRFRYPFTNCTHCGPRLSIVRAIPYDRANTSMAVFKMCPNCQQEYDNPADRRFHAQPNACPICGPRVWLEDSDGKVLAHDLSGITDELDTARELLEQGKILAIRGIGGFHLACDATHDETVSRLRQRKRRYHKPFALMARDIDIIRRYCRVSEQERVLLEHTVAPIVVLDADGPQRVADAVAPGQRTLGFMLPYTPLHHLLLKELERPIVLTSGNLSHEPQCIDNAQAKERLGKIADYLLLHDRDIANRVDDSVVRLMDGTPRLLRRARGYAPASIKLPPGFEQAPPLLALGGELKNTFCLLKDGQAIVSQHMGDLEDAATYADYRHNIDLYLQLFQHPPKLLATDQHPEYLSTKLGKAWAEREDLTLEPVQHHHAHIASCMADNGLPLTSAPVLGIALDGLGFGEDGTLWGGEFLLADYRTFRRLATFSPVAMLGGAQAIREPWRNSYAHIATALGWADYQKDYTELELTRFFESKPLQTLNAMLESGFNSPRASSCGRLFDAVAAAIGICREEAAYEGQAAMELEALIDEKTLHEEDESLAYPFVIAANKGVLQLEFKPLWRALLADCKRKIPAGIIAARFHKGLARAVVAMALKSSRREGKRFVDTVALSGGVFQNKTLLELVAQHLREQDYTVHTQRQVPANDGGLALGQAAIAAARTLNPTTEE